MTESTTNLLPLRYARSATVRGHAALARELGVYPFEHPFSGPSGATFVENGREVVNVGSNNYLGLTTHPLVVEASVDAIRRYGTSCSGSRLMNGTLDLHLELEAELASFLDKPACLVTTTGFSANLVTLSALLGPSDLLVLDRASHASMYDGARLARVPMATFRNSDVGGLDRKLRQITKPTAALVAFEGVYSMEGATAAVADVIDTAHAHGAPVLIDEAHSFGVLGALGRGAAEAAGRLDDADIVTLTFSKSLASCGGAILADTGIIEHLRVESRPYIFTASAPPSAVAAALAALRVLRNEPELPARVRAGAARLRRGAAEAGWKPLPGEAGVVAVPVGNQVSAALAWRAMLDAGAYCNVAVPPAVPPTGCLLRLSVAATHTDDDIDRVSEALATARKALQHEAVPV